MKRMYVTLAVIFLLMVWAISALSQMGPSEPQSPAPQNFDRMKRRMELREEMHRRMREKLFHNRGGDDIFQGMNEFFEDAMSDFDISAPQMNFQHEWSESKDGRTLVLTPQEDQKLDIDVKSGMITIKGETKVQEENSSYSSSFSNSFSVPSDCDGSKVKMSQKDGKILLDFPFKDVKSISTKPNSEKKHERRPLPPMEGEVAI